MINYMTATAATLQTNSSTITVTGESVDFSKIDENYLVLLDNGLYVMPVVSGTTFNGSGTSTLTLTEPWQGAPLTNKKLLVLPVFAKIYETVETMSALNDVTRGILMNLKDLLTSTSPTLELQVGTTATIDTIPYGYLANQVQAAIDSLNDLADSFGTAAFKDVVSSNSSTSSDRVVTVGYKGLGVTNASESYPSYDGLSSGGGGFGFFSGEDTTNPIGGSISVINAPSNAGSTSYRVIFDYSGGPSKATAYIEKNLSGVSSGLEELYHSGNTNFNEFGGVATGNSIANGYARAANAARIYLPISSWSNPTSVTATGTFTLRVNNAIVESGLTPTSNSVSSLSSNRYAVIEFSTTVPMQLNGFVDVISDSPSSKITVNF
jgi:hypothetical protein